MCVFPPLSYRRERYEVANIGHVPALRRRLRGWSLPGRQETQVHHKVKEQQLDGKVQRGLPVVSLNSDTELCSDAIRWWLIVNLLLCSLVYLVRNPQTATSSRSQ